jgi:predicted membrane-bound spermidine synthase
VATDALGIRGGSLAACGAYLLPPVTCLAMAPPLVTALINQRIEDSGQSAGRVYAMSTVGGILATFLAAFVLIPGAGITNTAFLTAGLLLAPCIGYFSIVAHRPLPVLLALALAAGVALLRPTDVEREDARVVYRSSGILGEWTVLDRGPWRRLEAGQDVSVERHLLLNGIDQTYTQLGFEPLSLWRYPHKIAAYASMKPPGSKALLLGMGGGSIAFELKAMGLELDIVELDARIGDIAQRYFRYDPATARLHIDDARHFLRTSTARYDVVVIDLLIGEVQPTHVFSTEGFADLKQRLADDGLVIINFQGYMNDDASSLAPRSIYRTLQAAGFHTSYYAAPDGTDPTGDVFFLASLRPQDYRELMRDLRYNRWFVYDHFGYEDLIREDPPRLDDAAVLMDDRPRLEALNAGNILRWRQGKVEEHLRPMVRDGIAIFR